MAVVRKRLKKPALAGPRLPAEGAYLWAAFLELDATRGGGMGPGPITHTEIYHYAKLHGFAWSPFELAAIRALDVSFLKHQAAEQKRQMDQAKRG